MHPSFPVSARTFRVQSLARTARRGGAIALLAAGLANPAARADSSDALTLMQQAVAEAKSGQTTAALTDMQTAAAMRLNHPAYLYNLARIQALAGQTDAALESLTTIAGYGLDVPADTDPDFAVLKANRRFTRICRTLARNREPQGQASTAFILPGQTGLIEGIALRPSTGEIFFGDMHNRCIWRRDRAGQLTRFTKPDSVLPGLGGVGVDEAHGLLWAACSAQPVMAGWNEVDDNRDGLAAFDLRTGALKAFHTLAFDDRDHATVDLTVAANGTVYLSDSKAPVIWRLRPGARQLEPWIDDERFHSLQGLTLSADDRQLFAADYAQGLYRIDTTTGEITPLTPPPATTFVGIDGLARHGRQLIAMQNGTRPARVLAVDLDKSFSPVATHVLAAELPAMTDPALGCVSGNTYLFISHAGWDLFPTKDGAPAPLHDVPLLSIPLESKPAA